MKTFTAMARHALLAVITVMMAASCHVNSGGDSSYQIGTISRIVGSGPVRINDQPVTEGHPFYSGDTISTGSNAWATLTLENGGEIKLDQNTDPSIVMQWISSGICRIRMFIDIGRVIVDSECKVSATTGSGAVVETLGTRIHIHVTRTDSTLTVLHGRATFQGSAGEQQQVDAGYQSTAKKGNAAARPRRVDLNRVVDWSFPLEDPGFEGFSPTGSGQGDKIPVPRVTGKSLDNAGSILKRHRLQPGKVLYEPTNHRKQNDLVFDQKPLPEILVAPGSPVSLRVYRFTTANGEQQGVMVPKVTDTRYEEAIRLLKHLALSPGKISYRETQDRNLEGRVADQHPAPGVSVKAGTAVHLTVHQYRHPEQSGRKAVVPDLLGKKIPQAEIMIRESGLVLGEMVLKTTRLRQEAGRIFQQNPPHGTRVTPGTRVDIWAHEYFGQPSTLQIRP